MVTKAQTWAPGHYTDAQGKQYAGIIRSSPGGKGPFEGEGYIEFKDSEKGEVIPLSTSDLRSFVVGQDSFVVAKAPAGGKWSKLQTDFVRVVMNEEVKLYSLRVADGSPASYKGSGKTHKISNTARLLLGGYRADPNSAIAQNPTLTKDGLVKNAPNYTVPTAPTTYKTGPTNRGSNYKKSYYYGIGPNDLTYITDENFNDAIKATMQASPKVADYIIGNRFGLDNIEELIAYFNKEKAKSN
ncbi:hypothetical protein BC343_03190 [Mucilaginibacter pedocola]|uniref:Uncharacterized protein n=1 Tax=Mucilaginibacter pedocola TaxID=1792845 RepID=A0A1S9PMA7_9SPHI|nr:hypothetical protein BC343_03190 [Mucilaginibacter pedocola]